MKLNLRFISNITKGIKDNEIIFLKQKKVKNNYLKSLGKSIFDSLI